MVWLLITVLLASLTYASLRFFSWWSVILTLSGLICALLADTFVLKISLVVQLIVVAGIMTMSLTECSYLGDRFADIGVSDYIVGNFLLHYTLPVFTVILLERWPSVTHIELALIFSGLYLFTDFVLDYKCDSDILFRTRIIWITLLSVSGFGRLLYHHIHNHQAK